MPKVPTKIIMAVSDAIPEQPLNEIKKEVQSLRDVELRASIMQKLVEFIERYEVTFSALSTELNRDNKADVILHYAGHSGPEGIQVANKAGTKVLDPASLAGLIGAHSQRIRLVFLNSCYSQEIAEELVAAGAECVIGTTSRVKDRDAFLVARQFYLQLTSTSKTIAQAFELTRLHFEQVPPNEALADAFRNVRGFDTGSTLPTDFPWKLYRKPLNLGEAEVRPWLLVRPPRQRQPMDGQSGSIECPYPGIVSFQPNNAAFFFGRQKEIDALINRLSSANHTYFITGHSGSGKSSLVFGGLIPKLQQSKTENWEPKILRPSSPTFTQELFGLSSSTSAGWDTNDHRQSNVSPEKPSRRQLLIIDQFEEAFTSLSDKDRQDFFGQIKTWKLDKSFALIFTIREDYLNELLNNKIFPVTTDEIYWIAPLKGEALRSAIVEPASKQSVNIEKRLVDRLIADAANEPGALPLVQATMRLLWENVTSQKYWIRLKAYEGMGAAPRNAIGVALERMAEQAYQALSATQQEIARLIFIRLVQFNEGRDDTRRQLAERELRHVTDDKQGFGACLELLIGRRLLTRSGNAQQTDQHVDLAHEKLITAWPEFRKWIEANRNDEQARRQWENRVKEWIRLGEGKAGLLDEDTLRSADEWLKSEPAKRLGPTWKLAELAAASRKAVEAVAEKERERKRGLAEEYRTRAQVARRQGNVLAYLHQTAQAAMAGDEEDFIRYLLADAQSALPCTRLTHVFAHEQTPVGARFTLVGRRVLTWSVDHTARLWDVQSGQPVGPAMRHEGTVRGALFSQDETLILTWSDDQTARLWQAQNGQFAGVRLEHAGRVSGALFSPDDALIFTWSRSTGQLWQADNGRPAGEPVQHEGDIAGALFAQLNDRIVTWSSDGTARLWQVPGGQPLGAPMQHKAAVRGARFDAGETRILTWSADHTARLWDAQSGQPVGEPLQHAGEVRGALFSGDETRILTWSYDKTTRLWHTGSNQPTDVVLKHKETVTGARFNGDETRILTWSAGTAQLWQVEDGELVGKPMQHEKKIVGALFNPVGNLILTWSDDRTARLWDAASGQPAGAPMRHEGEVESALFNQAGNQAITLSRDKTAKLWSMRSDCPASVVMRHGQEVDGALFNASETLVLTWSLDGTANLWDAQSGQRSGAPLRHEGAVRGARFNGDETLILTWSDDKTARLWNRRSGKPATAPLRHEQEISGALFNPSGTRLVTWSADHAARIWDVRSGRPIGSPMQHEKRIIGVQYNPAGDRILTWSKDATVRLWDARNGHPVGDPMKPDNDIDTIGAAFNHDGTLVFTWIGNRHGGKVQLWDLQGKPVHEPLHYEDNLTDALLNGTGSRILTSSFDSIIRIRETTGQPVGEPMQHADLPVLGALFNAGETLVLSWSGDGIVRLWHAQTGQPVGELMRHEDVVWGGRFSPEGERILTWGDDHTARLWQIRIGPLLAQTGQLIGSPMGHEGEVRGALFNQAGTCILTWSADGSARLWHYEADLDLPPGLFQLQVQALTGTYVDEVTQAVRCLPVDEWLDRQARYEKEAKAHYGSCQYRKGNMWGKFHPKEATSRAFGQLLS